MPSSQAGKDRRRELFRYKMVYGAASSRGQNGMPP